MKIIYIDFTSSIVGCHLTRENSALFITIAFGNWFQEEHKA